jgi:hypothetical protein
MRGHDLGVIQRGRYSKGCTGLKGVVGDKQQDAHSESESQLNLRLNMTVTLSLPVAHHDDLARESRGTKIIFARYRCTEIIFSEKSS